MRMRPLRRTGRARIRGSPGGGIPVSSSSGTWYARASDSSSSRVGLRSPDSSRDRVLTEMPVTSERPASVVPRCWRKARSRGPTAASTGSGFIPLLLIQQENLSTGRPPAHGGPMDENMKENYDVVVVGGGAAGLSGALALARSRRSVLVADAGDPRNAPAGHVHNFLTRDGTPPAEIYAAGRAEVARYGGQVTDARVTGLSRDGARFRAGIGGRAVTARRLLIATGLRDELPGVPGLAARWGSDVVHCPYCHGWEVRDKRIGVLATGPMAMHQALLFHQLSPQVTMLAHTGPELTGEEREQLAALGIEVVEGEVARIEAGPDGLTGARLAGGRRVPLDVVAVTPRMPARADLLAPLGLRPAEIRA